jgi:putative FmdB family regulatory protein
MPTYVYGCDACGHQFEKFQKFSDDPIRSCPECDSPVRRIFQPAGIVFKGSGWHITDYKRSGNGSHSDGSTSNGKGEPAAAGDAKTESSAGESKAKASDPPSTPSATP